MQAAKSGTRPFSRMGVMFVFATVVLLMARDSAGPSRQRQAAKEARKAANQSPGDKALARKADQLEGAANSHDSRKNDEVAHRADDVNHDENMRMGRGGGTGMPGSRHSGAL